jgi:hypothetical protein
MNYTDDQLKQALAKMLPETCYMTQPDNKLLAWKDGHLVRDIELLHLCWLVEDNLTEKEYEAYIYATYDFQLEMVAKTTKKWLWLSMPWQQRVETLAKVKGIEI